MVVGRSSGRAGWSGMELFGKRHLHMGSSLNAVTRVLRWLCGPVSVPTLFVVFLVPRALVLLLAVEPTSDAAWYFNRAVALVAGHGYSEGGVLTAYWPPGWSLTLSVVFNLFGTSVVAAQIFNLACSLLIAWLTMDLGHRLFSSAVAGRVALFLLAIYPNNIGYVPLVMTEVFYTMLLLLGCWLLVVYESVFALILAGLIFGLATLVKAQSIIVIVFIFAIDFLRKFDVHQIRNDLIKATIVMAITFAVISAWSYRNYQIFGEFVLVSTNGGLTLLTGNNPSARGDYTYDDPLVTSLHRSVATQVEVDKEAKHRAIEWIKQNPGRFVVLMPLKIFRLWAPDGEAEWAFQAGYGNYNAYVFWFRTIRYLNQAYYSLLLAGFAWAGVLLFSGKLKLSESRIDRWALPYAVALYPTMIALVFSGQSRFHYPVMPFVVMGCGWLISTRCSPLRISR
jgi:hypothetical protein